LPTTPSDVQFFKFCLLQALHGCILKNALQPAAKLGTAISAPPSHLHEPTHNCQNGSVTRCVAFRFSALLLLVHMDGPRRPGSDEYAFYAGVADH